MNVRDVFFNKVYELVKSGEDLMIVSSDIGAPSLDDFRKYYPQRFVNVGIAEQNSLAVAAGLELTGKKVITYGLNPFPVTRAFDQIRNIMASFKIPITVTGLKAGTCTAEAGFSHMAIENLSLLRTLRNIKIINPSDESISRKAAEEIVRKPAPRYLQFDPYIMDTLYDEGNIDFEKGFITSGGKRDAVVVTCGKMVQDVRELDIDVKVIDCFCLPVNEELFIKEIMDSRIIVTIEDSIAEGGIGSMVLEILNDHELNIPVYRMALRFRDGYPKVYTNRSMIHKEEGLSADRLLKIIR